MPFRCLGFVEEPARGYVVDAPGDGLDRNLLIQQGLGPIRMHFCERSDINHTTLPKIALGLLYRSENR